jgi:hypothetical protein
MNLAFAQGLAGDTAGAKVTADTACRTLEEFQRDRSDDPVVTMSLASAYALTREKDCALKTAEGALMLRAQDAMTGPSLEEDLAAIQAALGENYSAIVILTRLLKTPYQGDDHIPAPITPALLRLDPIWDPLRSAPGFQRLAERSEQRPAARGVSRSEQRPPRSEERPVLQGVPPGG